MHRDRWLIGALTVSLLIGVASGPRGMGAGALRLPNSKSSARVKKHSDICITT